VCSDELEPLPTYFTNKAVLLNDHANAQNNSYWSAHSPRQIDEVPLYDIKVSAWCVLSATRIIVSIFSEILNPEIRFFFKFK
jgi:hypothetical protein